MRNGSDRDQTTGWWTARLSPEPQPPTGFVMRDRCDFVIYVDKQLCSKAELPDIYSLSMTSALLKGIYYIIVYS